jgi:hypothetical protein
VAAQGNYRGLASNDGNAGKYSDSIINALKATDDGGNAIGYRTSSTDIDNKYFHPSSCIYKHSATNNQGVPANCMS